MNFSLIICTYMRSEAILKLLKSVEEQIVYPNEILIIDGSLNNKTRTVLIDNKFKDLTYFKVEEKDRGLTKQRNYGISKVSNDIDIVCFLDDDIILNKDYFKNLLETYSQYPKAGGVGGYITNEVSWRILKEGQKPSIKEYEIDGFVRNLGSRNLIRKKLGLLSDKPPCVMPEFSNGFSVANLPPSNKIYIAEYFMGGVSSFKKEVVDFMKFSEYFEGYGLYEDLEYCLRVSKKYNLYVNTAATLEHHHNVSGRPNNFKYGKMVVINGWYVWRVKYKNPKLKPILKWHAIAILLALIRFVNIFTTSKRKEALTEFFGRIYGCFYLLFNKPKIKS